MGFSINTHLTAIENQLYLLLTWWNYSNFFSAWFNLHRKRNEILNTFYSFTRTQLYNQWKVVIFHSMMCVESCCGVCSLFVRKVTSAANWKTKECSHTHTLSVIFYSHSHIFTHPMTLSFALTHTRTFYLSYRPIHRCIFHTVHRFYSLVVHFICPSKSWESSQIHQNVLLAK